MASALYSQLPLNTSNSDIRTLTVHPSDGHEAPVICSLNVASLDGDCDFEALSYVWHEPTLANVAPVTILVNGCEFTPTPNLFSALRHLRLPQKSRKLWVDAICINQDDLDERNTQVPLMARIYTSAQAVAVWLGPSNDDVDSYARLEPQMAAETRLIEAAFSAHFGSLSGPADPKIVTEMEILLFDMAPKLQELFPGHYSLITNEYWSRIWTYQECCLPAASRIFYCGRNLLTWEQVGSRILKEHSDSLGACGKQLRTQRELSGKESYDPEKESYFEVSLQSAWMRFYLLDGSLTPRDSGSSGIWRPELQHYPVGLGKYLEETKFRKCTNPLDRFYALHGLVRYGSLPSPDYTKGLETVSAEIASHLVLEDYKLGNGPGCLFDKWDCRAQDASAVQCNNDWPSWVPDFRTPMPPSYIISRVGVEGSERNQVISVSQNLSTIAIQGRSFGSARILARFNSNPFDRIDLFVRGLGQTLSSLAAVPERESLRKRIDRLVKVLLFDGEVYNKDESVKYVLVQFLLCWHSESHMRPNLRLPKSSLWGELSYWQTIFGDQTEAKVMFVTDDLHLGFCDGQIRDGDIVARLGNNEAAVCCGGAKPGVPGIHRRKQSP